MGPRSYDELERQLIAARPEPPARFVRDLEASLFLRPEPERSRRRAWRPALAAAVTTAALGAVVLVLSLIGLSPVQGGDDPASARGCVTISEPRWIVRPTLVLTKSGEFRMEERRTKIYRQVTRCP